MRKIEKFIEVLQTFEQPVSILVWVQRIVERYPTILNQVNSKTNKKMTLRELTGFISLKVSKGEFKNLEIEDCEPYRKVKYCSESMRTESIQKTLHKDLELITLDEHIRDDLSKLNESERYRIEELATITDQLNRYFNLNFELHHVVSLINGKKEGKYHADNLQLLTIEHMIQKKDDEPRFTIDEQKAYIKGIIVVHTMVKKHLDINLIDEVLDMLLERLAKVYG